MKIWSFAHLAIAGFTALTFSEPLMAQDMYFPPSSFYTAMPEMQLQHNMQMQALENASNINDNDDNSDSEDVTPSAPLKGLTYIPSLEVRRSTFASVIEQARRIDPAHANHLQKVFAATDIIAEMDKKFQPLGLRTNNMADVFAIYLVGSWDVANNETMGNNPKVITAVKAQLENMLASSPDILSSSDTVKQVMSENLLMQMIFMSMDLEKARGNIAAQRGLAESARQGAGAIGFDLSVLKLTEQGFVGK